MRTYIVDVCKAVEEAFFRGDAAARTQIYTDYAERFIPDAPALRGRRAIAQAWQTALGADGDRVRVAVDEVPENGGWPMKSGASRL